MNCLETLTQLPGIISPLLSINRYATNMIKSNNQQVLGQMVNTRGHQQKDDSKSPCRTVNMSIISVRDSYIYMYMSRSLILLYTMSLKKLMHVQNI